jgi:signal transduction histidine kinase/DNA-binding response OmpR family regulator
MARRTLQVTRLVALFALLWFGALAVLTFVTLTLSDRAVRRQSENRVRANAQASAQLVGEELDGVAALVSSYAQRSSLVETIRTAKPGDPALRRHLQELVSARPGIATAFAARIDGVLLDIVPETPSIVGNDFSFRDWYRGVQARGAVYISEAYESQATGAPLVVAAAAPVRATTGDNVGIVVAGFSLDDVQRFVEDFAKAQQVDLFVTDQRGTIVAGPGREPGLHTFDNRGVRDAIAGSTRLDVGRDYVSVYTPVRTRGWTVVARVPRSSVYAPIAGLRRGVLGIAAVLALIGLGGLVLLRSLLRGQVRGERDVQIARDEALDASRMKSSFLANMSHEIRTPMNGVMGMTTLLLDTPLDDRQRDYVDAIRTSSDALLTVINDILDFSKIEAGRLDIETIDYDLRAVVEQVADLLANTAHAKGLEIVTEIGGDVPDHVRGDSSRVRQVLTNLTANAVKFTDTGSVSLHVTQRIAAPAHARLRFEVIDTGIGVDPARASQLFVAFTQADASTTRRYGGTGLGLSISRQLVELMGGEIGVESAAGEGARFWFELPLTAAEAPPVASTPRVALDGVRALLVDDNEVNRRVLAEMLARWGVDCTVAASPQEALDFVAAAPTAFDLALVDLHMPDMDGIELARRLRTDAPATKVLMLTSSSDRQELEAAADAGVLASITKPVRRAALYTLVTGALAGSDGREQPAAPRRTGRDTPPIEGDTPRRVLVVEDNPVNLRVAVHLLEKHGHRVDVAGDGLEALDAMALVPYDLVFMDGQMPELDGYDATMRQRAIETESGDGVSRTPIVGLTAAATSEDIDRCLAAGMDDVVTKPMTEDDLVRAVARWARARVEPETDGEPDLNIDGAALDSLISLDRDGSQGVLARLTESFLSEADARVVELRAATGANDGETVRRTAHRLKGSALYFGAVEVTALCHALEEGSRAPDLRDAGRLVERLAVEVERLRPLLPREIARRQRGSVPE